MIDPIDTLQTILQRNGHLVDLRNSEVDHYFLFDKISDPKDLDLAWSLFPAHSEVRARAEEVDTVSQIVPGWGYRVPKPSNRCTNRKLVAILRRHLNAIGPLLTNEWEDVRSMIENGYKVRIVDDATVKPPVGEENILISGISESIGEFMIEHCSLDNYLTKILYDWTIYLTKWDEVALYLLWPALNDVSSLDPATPDPGFKLWQCHCQTNFWIQDGDADSGIICVQPVVGNGKK